MTKRPKRSLGLLSLTALVVGNMVGSGIFLLPASLASFGTITLFSWCLTAIGALSLAFVFAHLSSHFSISGGPYLYCKEGFGDFVGFQVAYNYWIYMWVGNAAIAVAFTGYLTPFFPTLGENRLLAFLVTASLIWLITLINLLGMKKAKTVQVATTILKLIPLALIILVGPLFMKWSALKEFNISSHSSPFALSHGAALTLWAFLGLESASVPASHAKNPKKNIPKATLIGTAFAALIYIFSTAVIMGVIPPSILAHSKAPFTDVATLMFGSFGKWLISLGALAACFGTLSGWILLQAEVPLAAAKDHLFPKVFGKLSKKGRPAFGLVFSSLLITLLLLLNFSKGLVDQFTFIILLATLSAIITYLYTTVAKWIHLIRNKEQFSKKLLSSSLIACIAFFYSLWAFISAGETIIFYSAILSILGIPVYAKVMLTKEEKTAKQSTI